MSIQHSREDVSDKRDKFAFLSLLSIIEDPAFTILNDKHTLMIKRGNVYILVFSKDKGEEVFVRCNIKEDGIDLTDLDKMIPTYRIPEYKESKRLDRNLGIKMFSI